MGGAEPEPFIEPLGGVYFHDAKRHGLASARGLAEEAIHDRGADAAPLPRRLDKNLAEKICAVACRALQPAAVGAVEHDDPNLRHVPLAPEARDLQVSVQFQFTVNAFHFGEIEPLAIVEILGPGWAKSYN